METITIASSGEAQAIRKRAINRIIIYARRMNKAGRDLLSQPLLGTAYLHELLVLNHIDNDLYQQLVRLAEDPSLEYEIKIL